MPKDKERSVNPAQAQRKAEKNKAIKKGKAQIAQQRQTQLARRNPQRLEAQLADLKAIETKGGRLTNHERSLIEALEKDIKAVRKARELVGAGERGRNGEGRKEGEGGARKSDAERIRGGGPREGGMLGKRRRDNDVDEDDDDDGGDGDSVPEAVKSIPMPRDTPPPIAKNILDAWYARRRARLGHATLTNKAASLPHGDSSNPNRAPLGRTDRFPSQGHSQDNAAAPPPPPAEIRSVYESAPQIRNLRKEAVAFIPSTVRTKMDRGVSAVLVRAEADGSRSAPDDGDGRRARVESEDDEDG